MKEIIASIVEIADQLDEMGLKEYADVVDGIAEKVAAKKSKKKKDEGWPKELKEGRFTEWCKRNGFDGPCKSCADKAMKSDDASVRGMASFYVNTTLKKGKGKKKSKD